MSTPRAPAVAALSLVTAFSLSGCTERDLGAAAGAAVGAVIGSHLSDQTYGPPGYPPPRYGNPPPSRCNRVPVIEHDPYHGRPYVHHYELRCNHY